MLKRHVFLLYGSTFLNSIFLLSTLVLVSILFLPRSVFADVTYENTVFSKNTRLKSINKVYRFTGSTYVNKGATLIIEKGTRVIIDGSITVNGRLVFEGTKENPIQFESFNSSPYDGRFIGKPIIAIGGEVHISHLHMLGASSTIQSRQNIGFIDAYASSTVILDNVIFNTVSNNFGTGLISVWGNSDMNISSSTFKNVQSDNVISMYGQSGVTVSKSVFNMAGRRTSISAYTAQGKKDMAVLNVDRSIFEGSLITEGIRSSYTNIAIEIFNNVFMEIGLSVFSGFSKSALVMYSESRAEIKESEITDNLRGILSYNSHIHISESDIFKNTNGGAVIYGGSMEASNNWWGSETGPKNLLMNPRGTGDEFVGSGGITPWKSEKKKGPCCSNILFVPGLQGSRLYKKGAFFENQLWEPNRSADIEKLSLNKDGYSIDKSIYTRDIIDRTNLTFGGNDDIEVYRGLSKSLNGLVHNFSIREWESFPYDWRFSPYSIVTEGSKRESSVGQYKKMEEEVIRLSNTSKTGKVTLLSHSYGGIVVKSFLSYLSNRGKIDLIDKVVFVAVPETGSPSALFALLHGDNQDVGRGYIVSAASMRKFAQNMPSIYSLLPSTDRDLVVGIGSASTIEKSIPSILTTSELHNFLMNNSDRPSSANWLETHIPAVVNKSLLTKMLAERKLNSNQKDNMFANIEFYNILGVGLDTPDQITYKKKICPPTGIHPFLMPLYCGLDHRTRMSLYGDGVVLVDDFINAKSKLEQGTTSIVFDESARWGEKFVFNIKEYNRILSKNFGHSNIISAPPVISLLMQVFLQNVDIYALPKYLTKHGGTRRGGSDKSSDKPPIHEAEVLNENVSELDKNQETYQISVKDSVYVSVLNSLGVVSGIKLDLISTSTLPTSLSGPTSIIPIHQGAPNSSVSYSSGEYIVRDESFPEKITLKPDLQKLENSTGFTDIKIEKFGVTGDKISTVAQVNNIPINEYSNIEVIVDPHEINDFHIKITDTFDDVYQSVQKYKLPSFSTNNTNGGGASWNFTDLVEFGTSTAVSGSVKTELENTIDTIDSIRKEIRVSNVRPNFKERYLYRLNSVENNYRSSSLQKQRYSKLLLKSINDSLVAIIKDLRRSSAFRYKGGMRRGEVVFLYSQFMRLTLP